LHGACWLLEVGQAFKLPEKQIRILCAAFLIHDLNKFPDANGRSLKMLVHDNEYFGGKIKEWGIDEFVEDEDDLKQVHILIANHGEHSQRAVGESLFSVSTNSTTELEHLMQAADVSDLVHSFDAEQHLYDKLLRKVSAGVKKTLFWHGFRISEHRGVFTEKMRKAVINLFREQGAVEVLRFPQGSWFLAEKELCNIGTDEVAEQFHGLLSEDKASKLSLLVGKNTPTGIKPSLDILRLGVSSNLIYRAINDAIQKVDYEKKKAEFSSFSSDEFAVPNKEEFIYGEWLRTIYNLISKERNFFKNILGKNIGPGTEGVWELVRNEMGINCDFIDFLKIKEKAKERFAYCYPYLLGVYFRDKPELLSERIMVFLNRFAVKAESAPDYLHQYVRDNVSLLPAINADTVFSAYLNNYVQKSGNFKYGSYGATAQDATEWLSRDCPRGCAVQMFSNRLQANARRDPKRNVDPVTLAQFRCALSSQSGMTEKSIHVSFYSSGAVTDAQLNQMVRSFRFEEEDIQAINFDHKKNEFVPHKFYGIMVDRGNVSFGNAVVDKLIKLPDKESALANYFSAFENVFRFCLQNDLCALIVDSPTCAPMADFKFNGIQLIGMHQQVCRFLGTSQIKREDYRKIAERINDLRILDFSLKGKSNEKDRKKEYETKITVLLPAVNSGGMELWFVVERLLEKEKISSESFLKCMSVLRAFTMEGILKPKDLELIEEMAALCVSANLKKDDKLDFDKRSQVGHLMMFVMENCQRKPSTVSAELHLKNIRGELYEHLNRTRKYRVNFEKFNKWCDLFEKLFFEVCQGDMNILQENSKVYIAAYTLCVREKWIEKMNEKKENKE
jgi:hypothetical protein